MERFENGHAVASLDHVACKRQSAGAAADDRDLLAVGLRALDLLFHTVVALPVGGKALKVADGDGLVFHLQVDALALALFLLWAYASADGGQRTGFLESCRGLSKLAALDILDEFGDVDVDGTSGDALGVCAVEAACCLEHSLLGVDALVDFLIAGDAVGGVELGHDHALDGGALFGGVLCPQVDAPLFVARSVYIIVFHIGLDISC